MLFNHPATKEKQRDISAADLELCRAALSVSRNAYAPYSGFAVGSAVRTKNGKVYSGANLENASYGLGICAEVAAISAANSAGDYDIEAIALSGLTFWPEPRMDMVATPCGRCRQKIKEAADISNVDIKVICCNGDLSDIRVYPISELLPDAFGPKVLGTGVKWPEMRAALKKL